MKKILSIFIAVFLVMDYVSAKSLSLPHDIELQEGESFMLPLQNVARVAVGNGRVMNATVIDDNQVLLFAKKSGVSSLLIWQQDGRHEKFLVQVLSEEVKRNHIELMGFLKKIPSVHAEMVGQQLIIQGDDISEQDRYRIALLSKRYPNIIDFTNQLGWEKMITLEVLVIELPAHAMQDLGVRWDPTAQGGLNAGAAWDIGVGQSVLTRPGTSPIDVHLPSLGPAGYLGLNALFTAKLNLMLKQGDAKVLASPRLSTRSGSSAHFKAGGELPYASTDKDGNANTMFKPYGVSLNITPWADEQNMIRSHINVEVSSVDLSVTTTSGPGLKNRSTQTEFNIRAGDTMVLSGFLSREVSRETDAVPGLSDIPLLGYLFKNERIQQIDTELLILVTPHVNQTSTESFDKFNQELAEFLEQPSRLNMETTNPFQLKEDLWSE